MTLYEKIRSMFAESPGSESVTCTLALDDEGRPTIYVCGHIITLTEDSITETEEA